MNDEALFGDVVFTLYDIAIVNDIEPPGIRELLKSDNLSLRIGAAYVLGERGGIDAVPGLIDSSGSVSQETRASTNMRWKV